MTLNEAFSNLESARRGDDQSVMHMRQLYVAALALANVINDEVTNRLLNQQQTEPQNDYNRQC